MTPRLLPIARVAAWAIGLGAFALAVDAAGCIDPQADYDDFVARPVTQREASVVDVPLTPCEELLNQNPSGKYIMWCLPVQVPIPFAVAVDQTIVGGDGATPTIQFTIASLRSGAAKASDTVGMSVTLAPTKLNSDCTYHYDVGTLT